MHMNLYSKTDCILVLQYFSAKYSNAHLARYLPFTIPTYCGEQDGFYNVSFTPQGKGVVWTIANWPKVLQKASKEEGNVCIFTFLNVGQEAMSVHVEKMKP
jgi:hypothetical protein